MVDAWHHFGGDLAIGPSGDLACADGATLGQQRVLRRLLTSPGDYLWALDYGAGLGRFVGQSLDDARIAAVIRGQMAREAAVARQPEPVIEVSGDAAGRVYVQIRYADADGSSRGGSTQGGATQLLSFSVNNV